GGTGNDLIDGGSGNDLILGDNGTLDRTLTLNDFRQPLFRSLTGSVIYDTTTGASQAAGSQVDPQGANWWSDFQITLIELIGATGPFGNDYVAGGAGNDVIFGGNGDDVIQGDSSVDFRPGTTLPGVCSIGLVGSP